MYINILFIYFYVPHVLYWDASYYILTFFVRGHLPMKVKVNICHVEHTAYWASFTCKFALKIQYFFYFKYKEFPMPSVAIDLV